MRAYVSRPNGALASISMGCLLFCAPAAAGTFGVTLSSSGSAGDACQLTPQIDAEAFNSGNLSNSYFLSYSGSAVGYDNSAPYPAPGPYGCAYSPVYANVAANGTAALGVLKASVSADMTYSLVDAGASVTEGWNDSFTAVSGGTYLLTSSPTICAEPSGRELTPHRTTKHVDCG